MALANGYAGMSHLRASVYGDLNAMNEKLNSELVRVLFRQAPLVGVAFYILLAIVLNLFWGKLPGDVLLPWAVVNFVLATTLLFMSRVFHAGRYDIDGAAWLRIYTLFIFLLDLSWGVIGPLSFLSDNDINKMLVLFMMAGMAAAGIGTNGVVFKTYLVSIFSLLTPIIIAMAIHHDEVSNSMLVLTIVFIVFMLSVANNYSKSVRKNILLWLDNEELITELVKSKKEIEDSNVVLLSEIENRMKMEAELVSAKDRAEKASAAKNQFLANVSHELRTPLNGIIGFNSILQKSTLSPEDGRYVNQIENSARTLLNMVNDILDVTSIEAGYLKLYERPFLLRNEIADVMAVADTQAIQKKLGLNWVVDDEVPDRLIGDPERMKQVLTNIVSNAIKYTEEGAVSVRIHCTVQSDNEVNVGFEVEDTGIGIPESVQPNMFDTFIQGDSFEKKKVEGVGLGLSIVKNLLDKMGGSIKFESVEGKGTVFHFNLPFRRNTDMQIVPAGETTGNNTARDMEEPTWEVLRVLVVDDNEVNRLVLTSFLERLGVSFEEASSGGHALKKIETGKFDVVLMDIQMPDISGLEVASMLKRQDGALPSLVAVTAHAFPHQREEILETGFVDCLIKPISERELIRVLNHLTATPEVSPFQDRV